MDNGRKKNKKIRQSIKEAQQWINKSASKRI